MKALVLLGGPAPGADMVHSQAKDASLIICADRGMEVALEHGLFPHIVIGDMDSAAPDALGRIQAMGIQVLRAPAEKDETDAQLALDLAVQRGATKIAVLGGIGGRLDHTIANLQLLVRMARRGVDAVLMDGLHAIRALTGQCCLNGDPGDTLSILPVGPGVTAQESQGLYYPLPGRELPLDAPFAVSNRFTQHQASFTITGGYAWVIHISGAL